MITALVNSQLCSPGLDSNTLLQCSLQCCAMLEALPAEKREASGRFLDPRCLRRNFAHTGKV